ncbi:lytic murein transglycosylase [Alteromonadaceae bacterium BrNp21-10]|nr:lytic murein transglycosylase [Alteromonadaceae bacterium BrNp21-10]
MIVRLFSTLCLVLSLSVAAKPTFEEYVEQLKIEATEKGFTAEIIQLAFADIEFYQRAVKADKNQPEFKMTLDRYLATRLPDWKVEQAIKLYKENQELLEQVAKQYGVQARFIVALWGNESNFGKIQGKYPVISALTTLAYEGRRETLFKKQLFAAMQILQEGHISKAEFLGSWAGAMGQSQFMPTSFLNYAQDFDGDNKKNIWQNKADVFASIANYLKSEGWDDSQTWGRQVIIPEDFDLTLAGLDKTKMRSLQQWQALGIRRYDGSDLPSRDMQASLVMPDDEKGRIYLVYNNFHTLMKWNRSTYFGSSVSILADRIKAGL